MKTIKVLDKTFEIFIPHDEIVAAISRIAKELNDEYSSCPEPPLLLCTLNGALPFTAELMQRLDFEHELVCIKLTSYEGTHSTGSIKTVLGPTDDVKGKRVIIAEDIVDSGVTIIEMRKLLKELGAIDVRVCCLLYKPSNFRACMEQHGLSVEDHKPEFHAMEIPDDFIVGFGLDYNEFGRQYPDIYKLSDKNS